MGKGMASTGPSVASPNASDPAPVAPVPASPSAATGDRSFWSFLAYRLDVLEVLAFFGANPPPRWVIYLAVLVLILFPLLVMLYVMTRADIGWTGYALVAFAFALIIAYVLGIQWVRRTLDRFRLRETAE